MSDEHLSIEDVVVIGGGPAAHAAALYTASKRPVMFEGTMIGEIGPGGQLTTTTDVDNYPGFPHGVQGPELMKIMRGQSEAGGLRIMRLTVNAVEQTEKDGRPLFKVKTKKGEFLTRSVIVATGASAKRLYVPGTGDNEFWQRGISACAVCDGFFFRNKTVAVIGGGDSAMEDALYMSKIAKLVYVIHRRDEFRARKDKLEKAKRTENIKIITYASLVSAHGKDMLKYIKIKQGKDNSAIVDLPVDGLFFAIGHTPNVSFLNGLLKLRENGYVDADERGRTSVAGIFACGDVQDYYYRQAVTAVGNGCVTGLECLKYLESQNQ